MDGDFVATAEHVQACTGFFQQMGAKWMALEDEEAKKKMFGEKTPEEEAERKKIFDEIKAGDAMTQEEFFTYQTKMAEHDKALYGAGMIFNAEDSGIVFGGIASLSPEYEGIKWDDMYVKMKKVNALRKELSEKTE